MTNVLFCFKEPYFWYTTTTFDIRYSLFNIGHSNTFIHTSIRPHKVYPASMVNKTPQNTIKAVYRKNRSVTRCIVPRA